MVRRNWVGSARNCVDKLGSVKAVDFEFQEYRTSELKKEISKVEGLLKNEAL